MARKIFYSFHYTPDNWRAAQVRNMGVIEGNQAVSDNDWETITSGGDDAIREWIADQLVGKSCAVVLVGKETAGRKWITHEIQEAWNANKGVVGIHIHNLRDSNQNQCLMGNNPFDHLSLKQGGTKLSSIVKIYNPPYLDSSYVYGYIKDNISDWVEEAIEIRKNA